MTASALGRRAWVRQITGMYATAAAAQGTAAVPWLDLLDSYEAMMVTTSGLLLTTSGWPSMG